MSTGGTYQIGEVADQVGLSRRTVRYSEDAQQRCHELRCGLHAAERLADRLADDLRARTATA